MDQVEAAWMPSHQPSPIRRPSSSKIRCLWQDMWLLPCLSERGPSRPARAAATPGYRTRRAMQTPKHMFLQSCQPSPATSTSAVPVTLDFGWRVPVHTDEYYDLHEDRWEMFEAERLVPVMSKGIMQGHVLLPKQIDLRRPKGISTCGTNGSVHIGLHGRTAEWS